MGVIGGALRKSPNSAGSHGNWRGSHDSAIGSTSSASGGAGSDSNYYQPPTAVWGRAEYSVACPYVLDEARAKVYYHLSQLFPAERVERVMNDNPTVTDARSLCSLLIDVRLDD